MQAIYSKVKDHFERYTNADVVFVSGGKLFLTRSAAESYGTGDIKPVKRNNIESLLEKSEAQESVVSTIDEAVVEQVEDSTDTSAEAEEESAEEEIPTEEEVSTEEVFTAEDVELMDYNQLKTKVAELGIKVEDKKKETLKDALLSFVNKQL